MYGIFVVGDINPLISVNIGSDGVNSLVQVFDRIEVAKEVYDFHRKKSPKDKLYIREINPEQAKLNNWMNIYYPAWLETLYGEEL